MAGEEDGKPREVAPDPAAKEAATAAGGSMFRKKGNRGNIRKREDDDLGHEEASARNELLVHSLRYLGIFSCQCKQSPILHHCMPNILEWPEMQKCKHPFASLRHPLSRGLTPSASRVSDSPQKGLARSRPSPLRQGARSTRVGNCVVSPPSPSNRRLKKTATRRGWGRHTDIGD